MDDKSTDINRMSRDFPTLSAKQETDQFLDMVESLVDDLFLGVEMAEQTYDTLKQDIAAFALKQSIITES